MLKRLNVKNSFSEVILSHNKIKYFFKENDVKPITSHLDKIAARAVEFQEECINSDEELEELEDEEEGNTTSAVVLHDERAIRSQDVRNPSFYSSRHFFIYARTLYKFINLLVLMG